MVVHQPQRAQRKDALPVDLFEQAFGTKPDLAPVLGSEDAAQKLTLTIEGGSQSASRLKSARALIS